MFEFINYGSSCPLISWKTLNKTRPHVACVEEAHPIKKNVSKNFSVPVSILCMFVVPHTYHNQEQLLCK